MRSAAEPPITLRHAAGPRELSHVPFTVRLPPSPDDRAPRGSRDRRGMEVDRASSL